VRRSKRRGPGPPPFARLRRVRAPVSFLTLASFFLAMATPWRARAADVPAEIHRDVEGSVAPQATSTSAAPSAVGGEGPTAAPTPTVTASTAQPQVAAPDKTKLEAAPQGPPSKDKIAENAAHAIADSASDPLTLPTGGDKTGVSSQAISVPQGAGKIQGMGESFSAQLSTGIAMFSIPFSLPSARGDAQPSLGLSYSSSGGHGVAGLGWEIGVPYIARQTDRGLPQYADPATGGAWYPGQDRFVFNGGQELVPICLVSGGDCPGKIPADTTTTPPRPAEVMPTWANGWQYFRPRVEGGFLRFFWSPDHRSWRVQDKSGVTMELGGDDNALETNPDKPSQIFRWNLAREYDVNVDTSGNPVNIVAFRYLSAGGTSYLSDIYDTPPRIGAGTAALTTYAHHTRLNYEARTDVTFNYRRGWRVINALRLATVDVTSKTFEGDASSARELVRRYHLKYQAGYHASLLESLQHEGKCLPTNVFESGESLPATTSCARLPAMAMGYQHVTPFDTKGSPSTADLPGFEGFDQRVISMVSSPPNSIDEDLTDLFDVNSDGLPDVVVTAPGLFGGVHGAYFNGVDGKADTFKFDTMPVLGVLGADAGTITLKNINLAAGDLDGDGTIDLLHMPKVKSYAVYTPVGSGTKYAWKGRAITTADGLSPKIDFGKDASNQHVVDVNGDGLVDVVYVSGTEVDTFFSLGRFPGGDGQFGHAKWTSATTADLSTDPVRMCVPWSGTPVRFSDSEIRLGDMNGDGLADIVKIQKGNIQYWPGRGNGLWGTGGLDDCAAGTFGASRDVSMVSSPYYTEPDASALRLDDVNGDGLDDLVQVRFTDVDVWLNVDGIEWTERHVIAGTPPAPSYANRVRLVDINGSGTRDILWGDGGNYRYIDLAGGHRPWVLTHVANGLGKSTDLEYASSPSLMIAASKASETWSTTTPMPIHVVVREIERDNLAIVGRPAGEYVTEYKYKDPLYDGRQREFRGFRSTTVTRVGDANSPTSSTTSTFLLGECKDEDSSSGVDPCAVSQRWRDNPREALKGSPVLSETYDTSVPPVYLSTSHTTYTLRQLYAGLDGRAVRVVFASAQDHYLYDDGPFVAVTSGMSTSLVDVMLEKSVGVTPVSDVSSSVSVRSATTGTAHLQETTSIDAFGNVLEEKDLGCAAVAGACVEADESISAVTVPVLVSHASGWLYRSGDTSTVGSVGGARDVHHHTYDALGQPTFVTADLSGTLALDRFHETSATVAPAPSAASADGTIFLSEARYDGFGNAVVMRGANGHYRAITLDTPYADLPTSETTYAGPLASGGEHGTVELTASATYDRGLGLPRRVTDLHGEITEVTQDAFGRPLSLTAPDPTSVGDLSPLPTATIEYFLADSLGKPYSIIHTRTHIGATLSEDKYRNDWAYVDGLGRTIVTLAQADPSAGDGGDWVAHGLTEYDNKGAARRAYRGWFYTGDPATFPLSMTPPAKYGRQRNDAFGRPLETFNLDGTVTLASVYHALSADAWDAADLSPGPHYGTPASSRKDGHDRVVSTLERIHVGSTIEVRETKTTYLPTGEVSVITRKRGSDSVVRWIRYDSLGRMVLNVEPNTTVGFDPDPTTAASALKAWRYAFDDAGDLVGTSDARGCGSNYVYDTAGRLLAEDYSPCLAAHAAYSSPNLSARTGVEVLYHYDDADPDASSSPASDCESTLLKGRLASVADRASHTLSCFDGRGRLVKIAKRIAKPGVPDDAIADRYGAQWWTQTASYDAADRPVRESTGANVSELMGGDGKSEVVTSYSNRGSVKSVTGSYGTLMDHVIHDADGLPLEYQYGDLAATKTTFEYDDRKRLLNVQTYRGPPTAWTGSVSTYSPAPTYGSGSPTTFQTLLEDSDFFYDAVDNPVEIRDYRIPEEWPVGAKPVSRKMVYDDLYRLTRIDYSHKAGTDAWVSPFEPENSGTATDPKLAKPSPHVSFPNRILWQSFAYDWLGNTAQSSDDAEGFYDRSLGAVTNGTASAGPYQLTAASNESVGGGRTGHLTAAYDAAGSLKSMVVDRNGTCLPSGSPGAVCSERFVYDWDEVGRLVRARRWDLSDPGSATSAIPTSTATADLRYAYDASDQRVRKTGVDESAAELHSVYVFVGLEIRGAEWDGATESYASTNVTQVPYLIASSMRLARVAYEPSSAPSLDGARLHVVLSIVDHLGSTTTQVDKATSEVVERSTYQAYGGSESDYRPARWKGEREHYRFTGKEEDVEVGLQYFGARYYAPSLGRWVSADPLTVHGVQADANAYAYVHGQALRAIDPTGLEANANCNCSLDEGPATNTPYVETYTKAPSTKPAPKPPTPKPQPPPDPLANVDWRAENRRAEAPGPIESGVLRFGGDVIEGGLGAAVDVYRGKYRSAVIKANPALSVIASWGSAGEPGVEIAEGIRTGNTERIAYGVTAAAATIVGISQLGKLGGSTSTTAVTPLVEEVGSSGSGGNYVNLASEARTKHITVGDATGGGHMWPGQPGKSTFPQAWTVDEIMHHVSDIATDPAIPWKQQTGVPGAYYTKSGKPARFSATGDRGGITIQVVVEPAGEGIITAFPK
jgi:RHS repeat-associated protein